MAGPVKLLQRADHAGFPAALTPTPLSGALLAIAGKLGLQYKWHPDVLTVMPRNTIWGFWR